MSEYAQILDPSEIHHGEYVKLKKEFQVFKFPDPVRPSVISDIAYLPKSVYDKRFKEDKNI